MSKREAKLYLEDIAEAIRKIDKYTRGMSKQRFLSDEKSIDAVVRNFAVIGEAVTHLPKEIKAAHPDIAWKEIIGLRNKVVHEYFGVDEEILWKTVQEDLPVFKKQIKKLL